jgi:hypothetical protein
MNRRSWFSALAGGVAAWLGARPSIPLPPSLGGLTPAQRDLARKCAQISNVATTGWVCQMNGMKVTYVEIGVTGAIPEHPMVVSINGVDYLPRIRRIDQDVPAEIREMSTEEILARLSGPYPPPKA